MNVAIARPDKHAPAWLVWSALWVVYLVWGSTYLAIRVVVRTMPPLLAGGTRFLIAGTLMYLFLLLRRGPSGVSVRAREVAASALVGTALLLGGNGLVSVAEKEVPSGLAALIIASVPLFVVILRMVFEGGVKRATAVGVAVGFVGVSILVQPGSSEGAPLWGLLLLVVASVSWASGSFFSKRLPLPDDPFTSTAVQMLAGGAIMVAAGLLTGEAGAAEPGSFSLESMLALGYLVVAGSLLAFTAYTWLLQHAPISKVATYAYVNPVVAIFLGWLILSESITPAIAVGAAIIVGSVAFIVRQESRTATETTRASAPEVLETEISA